MDEILVLATIIAPVVLAVTEMFKRWGHTKPNYLPCVALLIGLFVGYAAFPFSDLSLVERFWSGGLAGLAATGLFELGSRGKKIIESDE